MSRNLSDRKLLKSCVIYRTEKKIRLPLKLSLLRQSCPESATASPHQRTQSAPDFIQIRLLSGTVPFTVRWYFRIQRCQQHGAVLRRGL